MLSIARLLSLTSSVSVFLKTEIKPQIYTSFIVGKIAHSVKTLDDNGVNRFGDYTFGNYGVPCRYYACIGFTIALCTSVSPLTLREGIDIPLSFAYILTLRYFRLIVLGRCCVVKLLRYATAYSGRRFGSPSPYNPDLR